MIIGMLEYSFDDVKIINNKKFIDNRGYFVVLFNDEIIKSQGINVKFVQDNYSISNKKGVIRGLHFQAEPLAQGKLVSVISGKIVDVIVDIRLGSPTYGHHMKVEISENEMNQVYVPVGFAHGFCTLEDNTRVMYKVTAPYSFEHDRGLLWNDPALEIEWPVSFDQAIVSDKDQQHPKLKDLKQF